jgi:hypothetical protein
MRFNEPRLGIRLENIWLGLLAGLDYIFSLSLLLSLHETLFYIGHLA